MAMRRWVTAMVFAAACGMLAAPAAMAQKKFDNATVTIGIIGGPWIDRVNLELKDEMAAAGITMKFVGGSAQDFLAKLIAARGQHFDVDVVEIDDATYDDFRKGNFLTKLNLANIPNISDMDHSMYDDYKVAYWASEPGMVYNVDKFKDAGIAPPQHYSDLANPKLAGRVLLADINSYMGYYEILGMAYENGGTETNPQPGFDLMSKMKLQSFGTSVATEIQLFKSGDVWAAAIPAHIAVRMFDAGINVASVHPVISGHKGATARGYLGITQNRENQAAAEYFINAIVEPHVQERLYTEAATIPVNNSTMAKVVNEVRVDKSGTPFLQLKPEVVAQTWVPDFAKIDRRNWVRQWQRAVAAQPQ
jgi:putative spermidine/putrescine transport system substrate-binding protein